MVEVKRKDGTFESVRAMPDEGWATNPGEWLKEPGESQR